MSRILSRGPSGTGETTGTTTFFIRDPLFPRPRYFFLSSSVYKTHSPLFSRRPELLCASQYNGNKPQAGKRFWKGHFKNNHLRLTFSNFKSNSILTRLIYGDCLFPFHIFDAFYLYIYVLYIYIYIYKETQYNRHLESSEI